VLELMVAACFVTLAESVGKLESEFCWFFFFFVRFTLFRLLRKNSNLAPPSFAVASPQEKKTLFPISSSADLYLVFERCP
jgi:hypothetical protein